MDLITNNNSALRVKSKKIKKDEKDKNIKNIKR